MRFRERSVTILAVGLAVALLLPDCGEKPPPAPVLDTALEQLARLLHADEGSVRELLAERGGESAESALRGVEDTAPQVHSVETDYNRSVADLAAELAQQRSDAERVTATVEAIEHDVFCSLLNQYLSGQTITADEASADVKSAVDQQILDYVLGDNVLASMVANIWGPLSGLNSSTDPEAQALQMHFDICAL